MAEGESLETREFVIPLEGRGIAHLYDYFMVRPVTHTGRETMLEALHHARSRRFPYVCNARRAQACAYLLNIRAHTRGGARARISRTPISGPVHREQRRNARQKVIHVKQKAEHGAA